MIWCSSASSSRIAVRMRESNPALSSCGERCVHLVATAGTCAGRHRIRLLIEESAYGLCGLPARRVVGDQSLNLTSTLFGVYEVFHAAGQIALIGARGKGARGVLSISGVEGNLSQALDYFVGVGNTLGTLLPREVPHDTCAEDDGQEGDTCTESGFGPGKCGQDLILRVLVLSVQVCVGLRHGINVS